MANPSRACEGKCGCSELHPQPRLVVITGGPGAGKTAILETAKKALCSHVAVLPEAASVVFGGGFWRLPSVAGRSAAQRAIFHVQRELETLVTSEGLWALGLCDRGTLDGLAYWPGTERDYWNELRSNRAAELGRYRAVIHLRTPSAGMGYNNDNLLRIETAREAAIIDERIARIWSAHPRYVQIESSSDFIEKAKAALRVIESEVPPCCRITV